MYRWVILSCSLLSSGLAILSDAGCFQMFFFFYYTSLVIPTTQMPSLTPLASFFQGPALKISQLTKPAPFSGLFPLASPIFYIGDLPSAFAIGGKIGAKEFDSYSIQLTRP